MCEDMYRSGMGAMDRDFGQGDLPTNRGFGSDSYGGMGKSEVTNEPLVVFCGAVKLNICLVPCRWRLWSWHV